MKDYYKYKYFFNASHSYNYDINNSHSHTFSITLYVENINKSFTSFSNIDAVVKEYLKHFSNQYLNQVPEFLSLNPTIENIGDTFYEKLKVILKDYNYNLIQLEINENPLKIYAISDEILICSENMENGKKRWESIIARKERYLYFKNEAMNNKN